VETECGATAMTRRGHHEVVGEVHGMTVRTATGPVIGSGPQSWRPRLVVDTQRWPPTILA
jgi:hypothetical protein